MTLTNRLYAGMAVMRSCGVDPTRMYPFNCRLYFDVGESELPPDACALLIENGFEVGAHSFFSHPVWVWPGATNDI